MLLYGKDPSIFGLAIPEPKRTARLLTEYFSISLIKWASLAAPAPTPISLFQQHAGGRTLPQMHKDHLFPKLDHHERHIDVLFGRILAGNLEDEILLVRRDGLLADVLNELRQSV